MGLSFTLVCGVAMMACADVPEEPSGSIASGTPEKAVAAAPEAPPEAAAAVARSGLRDWLGAIPRSRLEAYGFADEAEVAAATLGEPVALHRLQPDLPDPEERDPNAYVDRIAGQYLVPVLVNGQPRAFLRTRNVDGRFQIVGIGDAESASQYAIARAKWPADRGFRLRFARRDGGAEFLLVDTGAATHLVPLPAAVRVFHLGTPSIEQLDLASLPPAPAVMDKVRAAKGRAAPAMEPR